MDFGTILLLILLAVVGILIVVQIQIRKHHFVDSTHDAQKALGMVEQRFHSYSVSTDSDGNLSIPFGVGRVLVAADDVPGGARVEAWLSHYPFLSANGFQVLAYRQIVRKIRKSVA